ncbi:MAG: hypothetical protein IKG56_04290 [Clostridia bacterium]|nr:hypothetical protein [Clostridia bacterium]
MKKIILNVCILIVFILISLSKVYAASDSIELKSSSNSVKPGDTFTVTISAKSDKGINGIDTKLTYDTDKLELTESNVADSKWASLGADSDITVMSNTSSKITSADIWRLTFKVKSSVANGSKANVSIGDATLFTDDASNSSISLNGSSVTIQIGDNSSGEEENIVEEPTNTTNDTPTNETKEPETNTSGGSGNSSGSNSGNSSSSGSSSGSRTGGSGTNTSSSVSTTEKDPTTAKTSIPKTGIIHIAGIAFIIVALLAIFLHKKLKNYKGI